MSSLDLQMEVIIKKIQKFHKLIKIVTFSYSAIIILIATEKLLIITEQHNNLIWVQKYTILCLHLPFSAIKIYLLVYFCYMSENFFTILNVDSVNVD